MTRIKGKYRAVIEIDLDEEVIEGRLKPFDVLEHNWKNELSTIIREEISDFVDPASCKVTQEVAEIELIEE